jgi:hypothetical protein
MSSLARKMARRNASVLGRGPGMGQPGTPKARIVMRYNPDTESMEEFHLTKGWKKKRN